MKATRISAGLFLFVAMVWMVSDAGRRANAQGKVFNKWDCAPDIQCKDQMLAPGDFLYCYNQKGEQISGCTCNLTSTNRYRICNYTNNYLNNCTPDPNTLKVCSGTYVPPGTTTTKYCEVYQHECK